MPRVRLSANIIVVPKACPCCGEPGDREIAESARRTTGERVVRTKTSSLEFSVCSHCVAHLSMLTPRGEAMNLAMPGAWARFAANASTAEREAYAAARKPHCKASDVFADYEEWSGTARSFRFDSREYAEQFAARNRAAGKTVLLEDLNAAPADFAIPPQTLVARMRSAVASSPTPAPAPWTSAPQHYSPAPLVAPSPVQPIPKTSLVSMPGLLAAGLFALLLIVGVTCLASLGGGTSNPPRVAAPGEPPSAQPIMPAAQATPAPAPPASARRSSRRSRRHRHERDAGKPEDQIIEP